MASFFLLFDPRPFIQTHKPQTRPGSLPVRPQAVGRFHHVRSNVKLFSRRGSLPVHPHIYLFTFLTYLQVLYHVKQLLYIQMHHFFTFRPTTLQTSKPQTLAAVAGRKMNYRATCRSLICCNAAMANGGDGGIDSFGFGNGKFSLGLVVDCEAVALALQGLGSTAFGQTNSPGQRPTA